MKNTTRRIVMASMLATLICVATMIIKIPSPLHGYLNLGDGFVLLAAWTLSPVYGFMAAGLGSALADLFSGYLVYAPATFLIKGLMALVACLGLRLTFKKANSLLNKVLWGFLAELLMVGGYFLFEGFLYGFAPSAVNILPNCAQGLAGLLVGCLLAKIFEKNKISLN